jgi:cytochrome c
VKNEFEFDKIVLAIAFCIFIYIFSDNLGGLLYQTRNIIMQKGFPIPVTEITSDDTPKGIPEKIDIGQIMAQANPDAGKVIFAKCAVCHTGGKGEPNKVGPNLWGIVGAKTGRHIADFKYSNAMQKRAADGGNWDYEQLYRYLYAPGLYVVGTKMAFAGIKDDKDRANLIAFLRTLADQPLPLPKPQAAQATAGAAPSQPQAAQPTTATAPAQPQAAQPTTTTTPAQPQAAQPTAAAAPAQPQAAQPTTTAAPAQPQAAPVANNTQPTSK